MASVPIISHNDRSQVNLPDGLRVEILVSSGAAEFIPDIARLQLEVFSEFPHLYDNTPEQHTKLLQLMYGLSPNNLVILVFSGDELVGASTGRPVAEMMAGGGLAQRLEERGFDSDDFLYLSESVVRQGFRGRGLGVRFFEERESFARRLGLRNSCFCSVQRPDDHPLQPAEYRSMDGFFEKRGYRKLDDLTLEFSWKDLDEPKQTPKAMQLWVRSLQ
jgi:GNAT superfamily N-acetyltransferase